jgi:(p)ppGpp synthase/HD superfamily hydrolase
MFSDIINDSNDLVWNALEFATYQHRLQRRKGYEHLPYINHPIAVAGILKNKFFTRTEVP